MIGVVFDLGGVLVDWDSHYLLRQLMPDREAEVEHLERDVLKLEWYTERSRGASWHDAVDRGKAAGVVPSLMARAYHISLCHIL